MSPIELTFTYKNSDLSTTQDVVYVIMIDPDSYKKWKTDKSIPLAEVVDSFDILRYAHGRSGLKEKPSKRELEDAFGTSNEDDIVKKILEQGEYHGSGDNKPTYNNKDDGSSNVNN